MFHQIQNFITNLSIIGRGKRMMKVHTGKMQISPYNLPCKAQGRVEVWLFSHFNYTLNVGWWIMTCLCRFTPQKMDSEPIVLKAGWAPKFAWMNVKKRQLFAPVAAWTLKRPVHSESLYGLRYLDQMQLQQKKDSATPVCKTKGRLWKGYWHYSRRRFNRNSPLLKSHNTLRHSFQ